MGLLDYLNSPAGMGLLSAAAGYAAGARRGQPVNSLGRGALAGLTGYAQANDQLRMDEENKFQREYRNAQIEEIKRKQAEREAYRSQFKPAGTQPFQADNPFGEDLGTLQTSTPPTFAGQEIDPKLAAIAPFLEPKEMYQAVSPQAGSATAEMKNWQFAQGLPEDQRAQFFARAGGAAPATVQEWEFFKNLDPQSQARFLEMKRAPQIMNLGGSMAVRAPGGGVGEQYTVQPKITDMPGFQAAQAEAVEAAKAGVKTGTELSDVDRKAETDFAEIQRLAGEADRLLGKASSGNIDAFVSSGKRAVNMSDEKTQADASLNVISGQLVGKVPRFEGPQSDADRLLYQKMAGDIGNPNIPAADRKAALQTMLTMHKKYGSVQQAAPVQAKPKPQRPKPGTVQDGYRFLGGDPANPKMWVKVKQ